MVWDVDDVLNDLMRLWLEDQWLPDHPECTLCYQDIIENPLHKILDIEKRECLESLDTYRLQSFAHMSPNDEVLYWFKQYGHLFRHITLTATPLRTAHLSAAWVMKHFGHLDSYFSCCTF